jgi:hypothetical protein
MFDAGAYRPLVNKGFQWSFKHDREMSTVPEDSQDSVLSNRVYGTQTF